MSEPASSPAAAPAAPKAKPATLAQWTKHVSENVPANWTGTKEQYIALYKATLEQFQNQAEPALAKLFGDAARVGMAAKAALETPVVDIQISLRLDFSNIEVAQFNGTASFVEKSKHTASISAVEELNPKQRDFIKEGAHLPKPTADGAAPVPSNTVAFDPNAKKTDPKSAPGTSKAQPKAAPAPKTKEAKAEAKQTKGAPAPDTEAPPAATGTGTK